MLVVFLVSHDQETSVDCLDEGNEHNYVNILRFLSSSHISEFCWWVCGTSENSDYLACLM